MAPNTPAHEPAFRDPVLTMMNFHHGPLRHESLDVTLAYLKGKEVESEEAQEHANSSSLALYA